MDNSTQQTKTTKKEHRFRDGIFRTLVSVVFLYILGTILAGSIDYGLTPVTENSPEWETIVKYFYFIAFWVFILLAVLLVKRHRPFLKKLGPKSGNTLKLSALGALLGFGMNALCILFAWLNKDISLTFKGGAAGMFILAFLAVMIQSGAEEITCRMYIFQRLKMTYPLCIVSIIMSSLLFAAAHLVNNGINVLAIVNIFIIGVFYALIIYYFDALWFTILHHTVWNFTQNIVFGLPNSGQTTALHIFELDNSLVSNSFFYDAAFGVEKTYFVLVEFLLAIGVVIFIGEKRRAKGILPKALEKAEAAAEQQPDAETA